MYRFLGYEFSSNEIDAIVALLKSKRDKVEGIVDRRRLTKKVQMYALEVGLLKWEHDRLVYASRQPLSSEQIPVECLWRIVKPMLSNGVTGMALRNGIHWSHLWIPNHSEEQPSPQALQLMNAILFKLHQFGYIKLYNYGDVWEVHFKPLSPRNKKGCEDQ
ncbi:MAG: hypothetical protein H0V70_08960 [Ktedonobacteraceae bacterium]|nr:hypothetical protein [Ktedonobacteraceae bacterium]